MLVETYEQQVESHPEACEAANSMINELGLTGQQSLLSPDQSDTRCPYRQWHAIEAEVYGIMCPSVDKVEDYDADVIPLRVLQVLSHAKSLGIYCEFRVLHAANPAVKDPVLVGVPEGKTWDSPKWHILARWGAELDEFPVLVEKAAKLKAAQLLDGLRGQQQQINALVSRAEAAVADGHSLLGKTLPAFYANGW